MTTPGFSPGYKPLTRRHKTHLIADIHFSSRGPCWVVCDCGFRAEAECPEDLADDQIAHRLGHKSNGRTDR